MSSFSNLSGAEVVYTGQKAHQKPHYYSTPAIVDVLTRLIAATSLLQCVVSHSIFQTYIPNGANVPLPCNPGQGWPGVGHFLVAGTGARNPFGVDFEAAGKNWTKALCEKDSDGDGRRNGVELGDPLCVWKIGDTPTNTTGLSHPGICEPITDTACQQKVISWGEATTQKQWLDQVCKTEGFKCPALQEPDVANVTVRLPPGTRVPAKETTYECMIFNLSALGVPDNKTFHMVAVTPIIDNARLLHHMVLSGCQDDVEVTPGPYECGMLASEMCMQFLHVYTVGLDGECYHNQSGVKIGQGGYKYLAIQLHWNNVGSAANYTDTSGLKLYYTPHLKQYDAGVLMIGSNLFYLPPKRESVIIHSTCASGCTQQYMVGPIHVTFAWNHMHYAGRKMSIAIWRNGAFLTNLTNDETYSYDNPEVNLYPDPVVLLPGDEFSITCQYNTMNRNRTTFYGEATQDEMCYGFLTYYPLQNYTAPFCTDAYGISICNKASLGGCQLDYFLSQASNTTIVRDVLRDCRYFTPCIPECVDTLVKYFKSEPCLKGNVWDYIEYSLSLDPNGQYILGRIASCKEEVYQVLNPAPTPVKDDKDVGIRTATGSLCVLLLGVAITWMSS